MGNEIAKPSLESLVAERNQKCALLDFLKPFELIELVLNYDVVMNIITLPTPFFCGSFGEGTYHFMCKGIQGKTDFIFCPLLRLVNFHSTAKSCNPDEGQVQASSSFQFDGQYWRTFSKQPEKKYSSFDEALESHMLFREYDYAKEAPFLMEAVEDFKHLCKFPEIL
jgi:hypothetical protein